MSYPVTMLFSESGNGRSFVLEQMSFEETYRAISSSPVNFKKGINRYVYIDDTVDEAWQLWQQARRSPDYANRATVELVQDLLKFVEGNDVYEFYEELRKRANAFIEMNKDKINNVFVGPWTDGKKE